MTGAPTALRELQELQEMGEAILGPVRARQAVAWFAIGPMVLDLLGFDPPGEGP